MFSIEACRDKESQKGGPREGARKTYRQCSLNLPDEHWSVVPEYRQGILVELCRIVMTLNEGPARHQLHHRLLVVLGNVIQGQDLVVSEDARFNEIVQHALHQNNLIRLCPLDCSQGVLSSIEAIQNRRCVVLLSIAVHSVRQRALDELQCVDRVG